MRHQLLAKLEQSPSASFSESELLANHRTEFEFLREVGCVHRLAVPAGAVQVIHNGASVLAIRDGDNWLGISEGEEEPELISIDPAEVERWTIDLPGVCRQIQERNQLSGQPERLTERLWFIGEDVDCSVVLALVNHQEGLRLLAAAIGSWLGSKARPVALVLPHFQPSHASLRFLEGARISVVSLTSELLLERQGIPASNTPALSVPLTPGQDFVLRILREARLAGTEPVPHAELIRRLQAAKFSTQRVKHLFAGYPEAGALISSPKKGLYQLAPESNVKTT